jgi:hypothetical protein
MPTSGVSRKNQNSSAATGYETRLWQIADAHRESQRADPDDPTNAAALRMAPPGVSGETRRVQLKYRNPTS